MSDISLSTYQAGIMAAQPCPFMAGTVRPSTNILFTYLRNVCPAQQEGSLSSMAGQNKKILKSQNLSDKYFSACLLFTKNLASAFDFCGRAEKKNSKKP